MRAPRLALLSLSLVSVGPFLAAPAAASTSLTYEGIITSGPAHLGEAVSITFVLSDDPLATAANPFRYIDERVTVDRDLFHGILGDDLTGSWQRPVGFDADPYSVVFRRMDEVGVRADEDSVASGLSLFYRGDRLSKLDFAATLLVTQGWATPSGTYADLFLGLAGDYAVTGSGIIGLLSGPEYVVSIDRLLVVPEPSTYGLMLGALAVAVAAARRRRREG